MAFCLTWEQHRGPPLRVQGASSPLEMKVAGEDLPPGLKGHPDKALYDTARSRAHACVGRQRAGGHAFATAGASAGH